MPPLTSPAPAPRLRKLQFTCPELGACRKRRCGGPRAEAFNLTCDRARELPFAADWLVEHVGGQVQQRLQSAAAVNQHLNKPGVALIRRAPGEIEVAPWMPAAFVACSCW